MAVVFGPNLFLRIPRDAVVVHTNLPVHASPATRLEKRVHELTRFRHVTFVLVALAIVAWAALKFVVYQKFGGFYFGWLDFVIAPVIVLVVGAPA